VKRGIYLFLLVLAFSLLSSDDHLYSDYQDNQSTRDQRGSEAYQSAGDHESVSFEGIGRQRVGLSSGDIVEAPEIDGKCNPECQRAIKDLEAQTDMAFWAMAMFWTSLSTAIVTAVGVYYVARTLGASVAAANAGLEAAEAATAANELHRQAIIAQQRAWIVVRNIDPIDGLNWHGSLIRIGFQINLENIGTTVAKRMYAHINSFVWRRSQIYELIEHSRCIFHDVSDSMKYNLAPKDVMSIPLEYGMSIQEDKLTDIDESEVVVCIFIAGRVVYYVNYEDGPHTTEFLYIVKPKLNPPVFRLSVDMPKDQISFVRMPEGALTLD
jgi:hypothetical protein